MNNVGYTILSRQHGLLSELDSIANNVANSDTVGYRRKGYVFSEYIHELDHQQFSLSQTRVAGHFVDQSHGSLTKTGNAFDLAIEGKGYFVVATPRGDRLTRAGAFTLNTQNQVTTLEGYTVVGEGGSPITIPPDSLDITVSSDGTLSSGDAPIGKLSAVYADPTTLAREGDNLFRPENGYEELVETSLRQGFLETSNVNPVLEISRLISVQRAFEMGQQLMRDEDERISTTIQRMSQG